MDLSFTKEERAFREKVRRFLRDNMPTELPRKLAGDRQLIKEEKRIGARVLNKLGIPTWRKEYGGAGWTPVQHYIFEEEVLNFSQLIQLPFMCDGPERAPFNEPSGPGARGTGPLTAVMRQQTVGFSWLARLMSCAQ
ncbi:hypothetical protein CVM73_35245 [Bradyrhizobium forestalis]|uniref:Acyl-CoA dehydrogenase/oxidase N-terminal domain-containing protein n=1 Tax=Bradyrhizobium forestalis TaxID=1419263 RepID=A0A2M8QYK8_9BRAD|nr:acyl-CoA dehydrogenase family protein [Bradyrhizobium forestalis]PJG50648.1 hypothetical protein CVM73_35245 [Bradyrhizobium forestalis]